MEKVPEGSSVTRIRWLNTPDKYDSPLRFADLALARAYATSGVITAELELATPDGRMIAIAGGVATADSIWRESPRQDPGVLPAWGAQLVTIEVRDHVFANPDGGQWVLIAD
ncbi:hypothetical protein [Amycolatopsis plumensis]|uniref:Uncharacterized protein n=1 Tax=Amycolatopsis plumensis TaxID=236508 RepID=A0ABV5U5Z6_9PSEU